MRKDILDAAVTIAVAMAMVLTYAFLTRPADPIPGGEIDARLDRIIEVMYCEKADLDTVIQVLSDQTGLEIAPDWEGLASAKAMTRGSITVLWERDVPAWRLLDNIVTQIEMRPLEWRLEQGRIIIAPSRGAVPRLSLRLYDVNDLVDEAVHRQVEVHKRLQSTKGAGVAPPRRAVFESDAMNDLLLLAGLELAAPPPIPARGALNPPAALVAWPGMLVANVPDEHHRRIEDLLEVLRQR